MKLELKHLAPYLPYGLKIISYRGLDRLIGITYSDDTNYSDARPTFHNIEHPLANTEFRTVEFHEIQPLLKSLNDLEIEDLDFSEYTTFDDFRAEIKEQLCNYETMVYLFERHYDVFGLIDADLAIDINTLK